MTRAISAGLSIPRAQIIVLLLVGIISVGSVLRFAGMGSVGPYSSDEFHYLNMGRLVATGFDAVALRARSFSEVEGLPPNSAKPLHAFLIGTAMILVRDDRAIWAGHLVGALFGTLTIALVYILGRQLAGVAAGLIAASITAVSAYAVHYSRNAFAEADATFFVYLALTLLIASWRVRSQKRASWLSFATGVAAGLSMAANYRFAWVPVLMLAFGLARLVSRRRLPTRSEMMPLSAIFLGSITPALLYAVPLYVIGRLLIDSFDEVKFTWTYFHQLYFLIFLSDSSGGIGVDLRLYPRLWLMTDGILPIFLFVAGSFAMLRRRSPLLLAVLSIVVVPYLYHSVAAYHASRFFLVALPGLAVVGGCCVYALPKSARLSTAAAVSVLIMAVGFPMTWSQLSFSPTPYETMAIEMKERRIQAHYSHWVVRSWFWFNQSYVFALGDHESPLRDELENYSCPELKAEYALARAPVVVNALQRQGAATVAEVEIPPLPSVLYYFEERGSFEGSLESFRSRFDPPGKRLRLMTLCDSENF